MSVDVDKQLDLDQKKLRSNLDRLAWYHGNINRNLAELRLKKENRDGVFLVRQSMMCPADFVLSLLHEGKCHHFMIEELSGDRCFCMAKGNIHEGLDRLIDHHRQGQHGLPSRLLRPCPQGELPSCNVIMTGHTNILHNAIHKGNKALIKELVSKMPTVDWKDDSGQTALHIAVKKNMDDVVRWLLFIGNAYVDILDGSGYTPLYRACELNYYDLVKLLLNEGKANPQKGHRETCNVPLHEAARKGHVETVQAMLAWHVPVWPRNAKKQTPYELAIKYSHQNVAKMLDSYKPLPAKTKKEYWFHGDLSREAATALLENTLQDGYFLVRNSSQSSQYALSVCHKSRIHNIKILSLSDKAYYLMEGPLIYSIEHFVQHYTKYKDGLPTLLTHSVDKNGMVRSMSGGAVIQSAPVIRRNPTLPPRNRLEPGKEFVEINKEDLKLGDELGQGEYGSVLMGEWKMPGDNVWHKVAIKTLNQEQMSNSIDAFLREAKVMLNFDHSCIVRLIGISHGPPLMLVEELLPNGSLQDFLLDYPTAIDMTQDIYRWAAQIACGMDYLESKKFVHRDLASRNILLLDKSQAKVADFGLSRAVGEGNDYYRATKGGRWPVKWYAPECMYYGTFSHQSDVWSYGVTLWEMYTLGEQPYADKNGAQVVQFIEGGSRLEQPDACPDNVYDTMRKCWEYEASKRMTFKQLHKFFMSRSQYSNVQ